MTTHTPGPWNVQDLSGSLVNADGRGSVASVVRRGTVGEQESNARLIASAPTMHDYIKVKADSGDSEAKKIMEAIRGNC